MIKQHTKESHKVWRKIEIRGDQTLHNLHNVIFEANEHYTDGMEWQSQSTTAIV